MSLETTKYLVGPGGARLFWSDGQVTSLPERAVVRLERRPRQIIGRLIPLRDGQPVYEAPQWRPRT